MTPIEIQKTVDKAQKGDKSALEKLYNHFFNQIYFYVYSRVSSLHDTQEITSEIFLSIVENISEFRGDSSFKNYIFGIAKNKIFNYIREKYQMSDFILESYFADQSFDKIIQEEPDFSYRNKLIKAFKLVLQSLNPRYAKVLDLRFNQKNSVQETAQILGISDNNVKVIQFRAIKQAGKVWQNLNADIKQKLLKR